MPPSTKRVQIVLLAVACATAVACHRQAVHAAPPETAPATPEGTKPSPAGATESGAAGKSAPANTGAETSAPGSAPATIPAPKPVEPKPRPAPPPAAAPPETPAPKPAPPQITLRISPADEAQLKSQTQKAVAEAEANLHKASGRPLSDAQRDMVEKIQSFLSQSREASEIPDWSRARILAEKARLLSVELANSL
jgi:hypothetical protein